MQNRRRMLQVATAGMLSALAAAPFSTAARAQEAASPPSRIQDAASPLLAVADAVVRIKTFITPDGTSVGNLGREREGSGVVIDEAGLILTIGYLMVEAHAAELQTTAGRTVPASIVGYDHDTGFGLLRALEPLKIKPLPIGSATSLKVGDRALAAGFGGLSGMAPVEVVSRREFAGSWEYLVPDAIFTAPPHPAWSGAALVSREGRLVGIGSLIVGNAGGPEIARPGNMFVPVDGLMPILGDLLADGRASGPQKPWLGVNAEEVAGRLVVARVTPGSPAAQADIRRGDIVAGLDGELTETLPLFYRKLWARGSAGAIVPLDVTRSGKTVRVDITSVGRLDRLKLKSSF